MPYWVALVLGHLLCKKWSDMVHMTLSQSKIVYMQDVQQGGANIAMTRSESVLY